MVTLDLMDANTIGFIVLLVAAFIFTFLSFRISVLWFLTGFIWLGVAALSSNQWFAVAGSFMALFCEILFLAGGPEKARRRKG